MDSLRPTFRDKESEGSHQQHLQHISEVYAVRHGRNVNNCIFFSWEDAKKHILNFEQSEYCVFDAVQGAVQYLFPNSTITLDSKKAKSAMMTRAAENDASDPYDGNEEVAEAAATLERINTDHLYEPKEVEQQMETDDQEEDDEDEESDPADSPEERAAASAISPGSVRTMSTSVKIPKENETLQVDGRVIHKRRPSKNWMAMFRKLQEYRDKSGSFYIPASDTTNIPLKRWISEQKHQYKCYKLGRKHFSSQMKRQLLNSIGFDFEFHSFDERLEQLKRFKEVNGSVNVPHNDPLLGSWMETQRRQLVLFNKGKESKLNTDRVERLGAVGMDIVNVEKPIIKPRSETNESMKKWDDMFELLRQYHVANGHCQVPKSDTDNQFLYKWVCQQRLEYKKLRQEHGNKMTASRLQKLNDIGFVFNPRSAYLRWEERMDQLRAFKIQHGHLRVPVTDPEIGEFVARQRVEYAKFNDGKPCNMTEQRARDLTELGFIFQVGKRRVSDAKIIRRSWDERFNELMQFKEIHGHTLVPQNNSALGEWVSLLDNFPYCNFYWKIIFIIFYFIQ